LEDIWLVATCVFFTGFLFAPLGLGGGLLFIPILHYVGELPITPSTLLISLCLTAMTAYGSGITHRREGLWNNEIIRKGLFGAIPGSIIGVIIVNMAGDNLNIIFKLLAMILIFWAIWKMYNRIIGLEKNEEKLGYNIAKLQMGSGIGGMLCSILAMGSGAIYVPTYRTYAELSHRVAIGCSYATMMVVIPVAFVTHAMLLDGEFTSLFVIIILPLAVLMGSMIGAKFGLRFSDIAVMYIFVLVLGLVLIKYCLDISDYLI
jgi:uncharacterized membrane protein YfcA